MADLIDRQQAIDAVKMGALSAATIYGRTDEGSTALYETVKAIKALPSAQPEQTKMIKEIRKWINSENRGSADYFIVDKIEEIINKYE